MYYSTESGDEAAAGQGSVRRASSPEDDGGLPGLVTGTPHPLQPGTAGASTLAMLEAGERVRLIEEIRALEDLKGAIAAAQARAAAAFDASTRRAQAAAGLKADQLGKGVAAEIALARRESPHHGAKLLGLARILTTEMPHTLHALSLGVINEWRATLLVRETACLTLADRQHVDEVVAGNLVELEQLGDRKLIARIKTLSYGLDPHAVVNRAAHAAAQRFVSCRPAPDTMTYLTALLPVTQGVGVYAALTREADRLRAAGDPRTKGQIMADTFVERATGQARAEDARIEVQLIMSDRALLHGIVPKDQMILPKDPETSPANNPAPTNTGTCPEGGQGGSAGPAADGQTASFVPDGAEPAVLAGYGMVPAQWARDLIRGPQTSHAGDKDQGPGEPSNSGSPHGGYGRSNGQDPGAGNSSTTGWGKGGSPPPCPDPRPDPQTEVWLRRLYTAPSSGQLTAMDSRARLVPAGLARLIAARDQVCRTPWCGAPIRHYDHIKPVHAGGTTSAENIQGLCQACNQAKEAPGWKTRPVELAKDRDRFTGSDRHLVVTSTPTGHRYLSSAPPLPTRAAETAGAPGEKKRNPAAVSTRASHSVPQGRVT